MNAAFRASDNLNFYWGNAGYSYHFNGKETDDETGIQDYGMRMYNPLLAKFLSVDPLQSSFAWYSVYQFAGCNPILNIDLDGCEEKKATGYPPNYIVNKVASIQINTTITIQKPDGTSYTPDNGQIINTVDGSMFVLGTKEYVGGDPFSGKQCVVDQNVILKKDLNGEYYIYQNPSSSPIIQDMPPVVGCEPKKCGYMENIGSRAKGETFDDWMKAGVATARNHLNEQVGGNQASCLAPSEQFNMSTPRITQITVTYNYQADGGQLSGAEVLKLQKEVQKKFGAVPVVVVQTQDGSMPTNESMLIDIDFTACTEPVKVPAPK